MLRYHIVHSADKDNSKVPSERQTSRQLEIEKPLFTPLPIRTRFLRSTCKDTIETITMFVDVRRKTAHNVMPKLSSGETVFTSGQQADYKQRRYSSTVKTDKEKRDEACDHVTATLEPGSLTTKVENVIKALDDIRNESSSESSDESSDESNEETHSNLGKDAKTQAESIRSFDKNQKFIEKCVQNVKGQNPYHLSERLIALKEFPLKVFKLYMLRTK